MCGPAAAAGLGAGFGLLVALILLPIALGYSRDGLALPMVVLGVVPIAAAAVFAAFTSLTVELDGRDLKWSFRYGFSRRSVPLAEIERFEDWEPHLWKLGPQYGPVRSLGWARCYCAGARQGICVHLRGGRRFCLETDEPKSLQFALREALAEVSEGREA